MNKFRLLAVAAVLAIVGLVVAPVAVSAHGSVTMNMRSGNIASVGKDEVLDSSVYLAGRTVTVAGTVKGDVYCAGQDIEVAGTVEGDVICAGQTVTVSGNVLGDVRVAGQTVTLAGPVAHSLTAFGQNVTVAGSAVVNLDATIYGTSVQVGGKIGRDATVGGEAVTLAGTIGRNVVAQVGQLAVGGGARIGGDVEYTSAKQLDKGNGATISGKTSRHDPPADEQKAQASSWSNQFWGVAFWFGSWLMFGLLLLALMPRNLKSTSELMIKQGGWALLAGLAALVLTPIVAVMLMFTLVGIPAGVALLLLWIVAMMAGCAYSGFALGQWIAAQTGWKLKWPSFTALVLGLFVLALLMLIPVVGGLFSFLALVWGLGGIVLAVGRYHAGRKVEQTAKKAKA
ncbi:MAG TPA: hypothetical protein VJM46_03570 [Candidatus Saccharimonadales bacterium]|nr:hypothetical protein [Candidatus Saccharimonadales bacterium]